MRVPKPRVRVIGTGGSIAGQGPHRLDYHLYTEVDQRLTIAQSLGRVPEVADIAQIQSEDFISVASTAIGAQEWLRLAQRINGLFDQEPDLAGIVVTHGTATLEETAYFLHLTVKSEKPVIVTGAMRPPTAVGTDADLNLIDAIRIAACPHAGGRGVLTILNNQIHSAREVTKLDSHRVETFGPGDLGFLGYVDSDAKVVFYRSPDRKHTTATPFDVAGLRTLPRVEIVYSYAGANGLLVDAVRRAKAEGLILAGFGGGSFPPLVEEAGARAVKDGMAVVLATRSVTGRVILTPKKERSGFIACDNLSPQKARILLMLALTITQDRRAIQQMFNEF